MQNAYRINMEWVGVPLSDWGGIRENVHFPAFVFTTKFDTGEDGVQRQPRHGEHQHDHDKHLDHFDLITNDSCSFYAVTLVGATCYQSYTGTHNTHTTQLQSFWFIELFSQSSSAIDPNSYTKQKVILFIKCSPPTCNHSKRGLWIINR